MVLTYYRPFGETLSLILEQPGLWWTAGECVMPLLWLTALVLVVRGSPRARGVVALAILARAALAWAPEYAPFVSVAREWLHSWLPVCLPLLPLVVIRVEEPRVVVALAVLGRWRQALAQSGGWRAGLVALALISLHRGAVAALSSDHWPHRVTQHLVALDVPYPWTGAMLPGLLFGVAALATWLFPPRPATTN